MVSPTEGPTQIPIQGGNAKASAIGGIADIDGDNRPELVYAGTSQTLKYIDYNSNTGNNETVDTGASIGANNNGVAIGDPADFALNGSVRIPAVDGSQNLVLYRTDGSKTVLIKEDSVSDANKKPKKSAVSSVDVDDDGRVEIVFINQNDKLAYYDYEDDTVTVLKDDGGNEQAAEDAPGTASLSSPTDSGLSFSHVLPSPLSKERTPTWSQVWTPSRQLRARTATMVNRRLPL
jgi:hypothetical protein